MRSSHRRELLGLNKHGGSREWTETPQERQERLTQIVRDLPKSNDHYVDYSGPAPVIRRKEESDD